MANWWDSAPVVRPAPQQARAPSAEQWWLAAPEVRATAPAPASGPPRIYDTGGFDPMGMPTGMTDVAPSDRGYAGAAADIGTGVDNVVRGIANGATFGLADKAAGGMDALTGHAGSYDEGVTAQRARTQQFRDDHPVIAGASELAGGLITGGGLAKNGVTLAGRVGSGLVPRGLAFGAEGAAYGAATGAGNTYSDNPMDYVANGGSGALTGGMIGFGLPFAGSAAGALFRGGQAVAGPTIEGAGRAASALLRGAAQADEPGLRGLFGLGEQGMLVDAGPAMLGLGQGAGTGTGPGRSALVNALRTRDEGVVPRINTMLDDTLGPAPIPSRVDAALEESQGLVGRQYDDMPFRGNMVNARALGETLDVAAHRLRGPAQSAVRRVRDMLDEVPEPGAPRARPPEGVSPVEMRANALEQTSAETLFETRQAIDGLLKGEADPKVIRQLTIARQGVDDLLARNVPDIKEADGQFAELARQRTALARGGMLFDTGKTAIRPAELVDELRAGALPQGAAVGPSGAPSRVRQGARAEVDRLVGTHANDLNTLERTLATPQDWNSQKFAAIFGEPEYQTVAQALKGERRMRQSYQDIVQGSQTAQRNASQRTMDGEIELPMDTSTTGLALNSGRAIWRALMGISRENTKDEVGQILSKQGPDAQRIMEALLAQAGTARERASIARALLANPQTAAAAGQYGGRPQSR